MPGIHHHLHAGIVDEVLGIDDVGKFLRHLARTAQKKPVRQFHNVGFVNGVNLFAAVLAGVLEGKFGDARGAFFGDDLMASTTPERPRAPDPRTRPRYFRAR